MVRRSAWWKQHLGRTNTVLDRSRNQLQWLDAGQYTDFGLRWRQDDKTGDKSDKKGKKSGHDSHSTVQEQVT